LNDYCPPVITKGIASLQPSCSGPNSSHAGLWADKEPEPQARRPEFLRLGKSFAQKYLAVFLRKALYRCKLDVSAPPGRTGAIRHCADEFRGDPVFFVWTKRSSDTAFQANEE
jgi:hypothetical protein